MNDLVAIGIVFVVLVISSIVWHIAGKIDGAGK